MPANDTIHDAVVSALRKDGWTVTDDPLTIEFEGLYLFVDVGASRAVAGRDDRLIAVEIKSFPSKSATADLQQALGQFVVYRTVLEVVEPRRKVYLAISTDVHQRVFSTPAVRTIRERLNVPLVVVNVSSEEVVSWTE